MNRLFKILSEHPDWKVFFKYEPDNLRLRITFSYLVIPKLKTGTTETITLEGFISAREIRAAQDKGIYIQYVLFEYTLERMKHDFIEKIKNEIH